MTKKSRIFLAEHSKFRCLASVAAIGIAALSQANAVCGDCDTGYAYCAIDCSQITMTPDEQTTPATVPLHTDMVLWVKGYNCGSKCPKPFTYPKDTLTKHQSLSITVTAGGSYTGASDVSASLKDYAAAKLTHTVSASLSGSATWTTNSTETLEKAEEKVTIPGCSTTGRKEFRSYYSSTAFQKKKGWTWSAPSRPNTKDSWPCTGSFTGTANGFCSNITASGNGAFEFKEWSFVWSDPSCDAVGGLTGPCKK